MARTARQGSGPGAGRRFMVERNRKLDVLRQCKDALAWLQDARAETITSLWTLRELFADPARAAGKWRQVLELMDQTFNVLLRGNQLVTDILHGLADLEGDDPHFRAILVEKLERLEATGERGVRAIRGFAEAVDPRFFSSQPRPLCAPAFLADGGDAPVLKAIRTHLGDLEAIIAEEERQLVDMETFLSLRGRDLEMGLAW